MSAVRAMIQLTEPEVNVSEDELADRIRARLQATGAQIVIPPMRTDDRSGKAIYSKDNPFLVKRLKSAGVPAEFLDESEDRAFESQYSAEFVILGTTAVGLATNAAYDVLKAAIRRLWPRNDSDISVTVTDATENAPAQVAVTGRPAEVLDLLEQTV